MTPAIQNEFRGRIIVFGEVVRRFAVALPVGRFKLSALRTGEGVRDPGSEHDWNVLAPCDTRFGAGYRFIKSTQDADHCTVRSKRGDILGGKSGIAPIAGAFVFMRIGEATA